MGTTERSLRLVSICPYPVLPAIAGGSVRIVKLAAALAQQGIDVTLVTPYHATQAQQQLDQLPFRLVQVRYPFVMSRFFLERPFPYQYCTSFHPGLSQLLRQHLAAADIVQFEQVPFARVAAQLPRSLPVVYASQNVEYDYTRAECSSNWVAKLVGQRISKLERCLIEQSHHLLAVTANDCERFTALYGADPAAMTIAPNGIDAPGRRQFDDRLALERFPGLAAFARRGLYSGSNSAHNRVAVEFLLQQVAPQRPDVAFVILGGCGSRYVSECRLPNVFFDSDLDRFDVYSAPGFLGLNTVTTGAGSNLKLLHYVSRGMPVITTPFGLRGFEDLTPYVTVCPPEHLAEAFDIEECSAIPPAILHKYEWSTIAGQIAQLYRRLASPSSPPVATSSPR
ncbi:MAG: glycosyltransferase [Planctomycetota bacterium]